MLATEKFTKIKIELSEKKIDVTGLNMRQISPNMRKRTQTQNYMGK